MENDRFQASIKWRRHLLPILDTNRFFFRINSPNGHEIRDLNAKPSQTWRTFLNNHANKCSIDFFTVPIYATVGLIWKDIHYMRVGTSHFFRLAYKAIAYHLFLNIFARQPNVTVPVCMSTVWWTTILNRNLYQHRTIGKSPQLRLLRIGFRHFDTFSNSIG
jgi:hypothetical protein